MGYRAQAGEVYSCRVAVYKINMLGSCEEDCVVLILASSRREHDFAQVNSYKALVTRPGGKTYVDNYFRFRIPPWTGDGESSRIA